MCLIGPERYLNNSIAGIAFNIHAAPWLPWLILLPACLAYFASSGNRTVWNSTVIGLVLLAGSTALHLFFARTGWFFRYEGYLIAWAILWVFVSWFDCRHAIVDAVTLPWGFVTGILAATAVISILMFAYFDGFRVNEAFSNASLSMKNVFDQPYQLGLFARDELPGATLLVNDMGAIAFLSDDKILDVIGLGSMEPALAKHHHAFDSAWLDGWLKREHAEVALVHITGPVSVAPLPNWISIVSWTVPDNYILACNTAYIYSLQPSAVVEVKKGLRKFLPRLPPDTKVQSGT